MAPRFYLPTVRFDLYLNDDYSQALRGNVVLLVRYHLKLLARSQTALLRGESVMRYIDSAYKAGFQEGSLTRPNELSNDEIDVQGVKNKPSVYLLIRREKYAIHYYVGRSDELKRRLKEHVRDGDYDEFKYRYCKNSTEAYERECELYHAYQAYCQEQPNVFLDNDIHPRKPKGKKKLKCPWPECEE